ncbi:MAG TPA: LutB/LldF family L-lactate oxidation iron-sulfur protein [Hyphomicrobium sp.]|nr:LutB/LldF family L-lactate oxidation iron-sulfur protein [Hyphomicrobium sp.]
MEHSAGSFETRAIEAIADGDLQSSLAALRRGFVGNRAKAVAAFPDFEALRTQGAAIKDHTLANLDYYLERYERAVTSRGGQVHWARDAAQACAIVREICRRTDAKTVTKGKSMVSEEIGLNAVLEAEGLEVLETDAGEYIVQLAGEAPSHIVMPTVHKTVDQISELFAEKHKEYGLPKTSDPAELIGQIRTVLRKKFFAADIGITGANFLVAETGSNIVVTNEGNGDLTSTLARVHVVTVGIEKVVPTLNDAVTMLRLLARSALGMEFTTYMSLMSGKKLAGDIDGPEEYHVVLVDNGRTKMLEGPYQPMLRCIRCGACMNHCPVYMSVGGHAYNWVYPGPMGAVLTPMIAGHEKGGELPHACTLNGRCQQVCPVKIPIPEMLRRLRHDQWEAGMISTKVRSGLGVWSWVVRKPRLYNLLARVAVRVMHAMGGKRGRIGSLPLGKGWTGARDMPAPQGKTFHEIWKQRKGAR